MVSDRTASQDGQEEDIPGKDHRIFSCEMFSKKISIYLLKINREKTGCTGLLCPFQTEGLCDSLRNVNKKI